jgi:hypothetical protein
VFDGGTSAAGVSSDDPQVATSLFVRCLEIQGDRQLLAQPKR